MVMPGTKTPDEWVARYERSHQHPVNRFCHTLGIPMIVVALLLGPVSIGVEGLRIPALVLFVLGWVLQFVGHAFEGKPPEFFRDWRFLFVGFRWWLMKISGRV
jgi:uncharacterized membrane protein YGL010W